MNPKFYRSHVLICTGTGCVSSGADNIKNRFAAKLEESGLETEVKLVETGCHGFCEKGPIVIVYPEGVFYCQVKADDIDEIVEEHLLKGRIVDRLLYTQLGTETKIPAYSEIDFYKKQHRVVLANCGRINPESIKEYIAVGGYEACGKALTEMTPEEVVAEVKESVSAARRLSFPTGAEMGVN